MSYQACPSFLFHSFCAYTISCPFVHIPIEKTCHSFTKRNFCDYFPNCKYLHVDSSLNYLPQPQDTLDPNSQKKVRKLLRNSVNFTQNSQEHALYTVNLSKELIVYEQMFRKYLKTFAENLEILKKMRTLSVNFNGNFVEKFPMVLSLLQNSIGNIENCKVFLTNVYMNDAFFVEIIGFLNKMSSLRGFQLSFQNCFLEKAGKTSELLEIFAEKLRKIQEFSFVVNYDYSLENNSDYQRILQAIFPKILAKVSKVELLLGFSNFELGEALKSLGDEQIFTQLETVFVSIANISCAKQAKSLGFLLKTMRNARNLCISFLSHDRKQLTQDKSLQKAVVFASETAISLENLRVLQALERFSLIFEDKIAKNPQALDKILGFLSTNRLKTLEIDLSYATSALDCPNFLAFLSKNSESLTNLSLKLSNSLLGKSFASTLPVVLRKLPNLRQVSLDFEFSRVSDGFLQKIAGSLSAWELVDSVSLNFCNNRIGERGCKALGISLKKLGFLEKLFVDLSFNTILDEGLRGFFKDLPRNIRSLVVLLERNAISQAGVRSLAAISEGKFANLRKIYVDLLNNPVGKQGNADLLGIFESLCGNHVSFVEGGWESDELDGENAGNDGKNLKKRKELLKIFLRKKRVLAYQLKIMKERLRKSFRKEVWTQIAVEKLAKVQQLQ